jgi:glycosyltransferase involved in cell wall biosynthesis
LTKHHVLIIGTVWVEPNSSAAGSRMLQLIEQFLKENWQVTFASTATKNNNSIDLSTYCINEVSIELNDVSFDVFVKELNPTVVVFDRFMAEEQFGWRVVKHCPKALRVLDTEDLHCLRKTRQDAHKKGTPFSEDLLLNSEVAKREIASILRCDLSLIISSFEMKVLQNVFKVDPKILCYVPFMVPSIQKEHVRDWPKFKDRNHFVFVGNFMHAPNVDAVLYLKNKIWKQIKSQIPTAELHIYGAYITQQISQLNKPKEGFIVKGFVEDVNTVVKNAKVVLAPLRFGAGIKGKLLEAMCNGTPSITTSIGAEGMHDGFEWNGAIADNLDELASKAVKLYQDQQLWESAQEKGVAIVNTLYEKTSLGNFLTDKIVSLSINITSHRTQNFMGQLLQHHSLQSTKYMSKWIEEKQKNQSAGL